jgi:hypothetical protein
MQAPKISCGISSQYPKDIEFAPPWTVGLAIFAEVVRVGSLGTGNFW